MVAILSNIVRRVIGSRNDRVLREKQKVVKKINELEKSIHCLSDESLAAKTAEFRQRLADGATLESLLPEAFAVVREAAVRTLGMRHFDVQLVGGMVLHEGNITEMLTGEGKTLVASLPCYLNALTGKGVHVVTVNDYLAKRDAEWMSPIYEFLGLTVGVNLSNADIEEKKAAYAADITYGTNNEFGFDYLRDNMAFSLEERVQRSLHFAIVDEVDSILIDESRTPLIISGPTEESSALYQQVDALIPTLVKQVDENDKDGDFYLEEKSRQAFLTDKGHEKIEKALVDVGLLASNESLYDARNITLMHHVYAALRAHHLFQVDVDYIVRNNEVVIVDEHTGRLMPGRRWSDGLHQAVEAKEKIPVKTENQTLASITFQNYFRLYEKLSGMTGTADTEAYEFQHTYGLEVIVIPPNKPVMRKDAPDKVFMTAGEKFTAIVEEIKNCYQQQQPVLVGTTSIETSEFLSSLLKKAEVPHEVLNAKQHEREAHIIAQAGRPGSVTIATNMAGRGTDIVLGGNVEVEIVALQEPSEVAIQQLKQSWKQRHQQVLAAGGLHVLATERHESRRIDNQLRGRAGRQGDPGSSRFYLSFEDNLLRIFASDKLAIIMKRIGGMQEGESLESAMLSRVIENAQRKVESFHFDLRKQLLEYDDVANDQRKVIYEERFNVMVAKDISETLQAMVTGAVNALIGQYIPPETMEEEWDIAGLTDVLATDFSVAAPVQQWLDEDNQLDEAAIQERVVKAINNNQENKRAQVDEASWQQLEKSVLLRHLDHAWKEHLAAMDHLRQGIHLRGYAQKNPKQEYKREAFEMFTDMLARLKYTVVSTLSSLQVEVSETVEAMEEERRRATVVPMAFEHDEVLGDNMDAINDGPQETVVANTAIDNGIYPIPKVGRNESCPCGSGKKYKQCHGKI